MNLLHARFGHAQSGRGVVVMCTQRGNDSLLFAGICHRPVLSQNSVICCALPVGPGSFGFLLLLPMSAFGD